MSDTGLTAPGITKPPRRYDVTITLDQDGHHPNPAKFAVGRPSRRHQPELPASS